MAEDGTEPAETRGLADASARNGVDPARWTALDVPVRDLLHLLPLIGEGLASTAGAGAATAEAGCYSPPSSVGDPLILERGQIALRVDASRLGAAVGESIGGEVVLDLSGAAGQSVHRMHPLTDTDRLLVTGLARTGAREQAERAAAALGGAVSPVRVPWEEADQLSQIDAVLEDDGAGRRARLSQDYQGEAGVGDCALIPALFEHLCATQLPVGVAVFSSGAAQLIRGGVQLVTGADEGCLHVGMDAALLDVDLRVLAELLLVRSHGPLGPTTSLELYDADGTVIAMMTQFGAVHPDVHRGWEAIVGQLPRTSL